MCRYHALRCIYIFSLSSTLAFNFENFGFDSEVSDEGSTFDFEEGSEDSQEINPFEKDFMGNGMQGFEGFGPSEESSEEKVTPAEVKKQKLETDEISESTEESSTEEETAKRVVRSIKEKHSRHHSKKKERSSRHHSKRKDKSKRHRVRSHQTDSIKKERKSKSIKQNMATNSTVTNTTTSKTLTTKNIIAKFTSNTTFNEIFIQSKEIKDDKEFKNLTAHILRSGLNIFASIKNKTTNYIFRNTMDDLADTYKSKYEDFLKETGKLKIKTRLGTQKVMLNAIDTSNHILKRLVNYAVDAMDHEGLLKYNLRSANNFQQEVNAQVNFEYNKACKELGICRTEEGFPNFLNEVITIILQCNDDKFKAAIDSLTEGAKDNEFSAIFSNKTRLHLENMIDRIESKRIGTIRPYVKIMKNILMNKNRPLMISKADRERGEINSTLGMLEIVDALEEKIPRNDANIIVWGDFRTNLTDWARGQRSDIQDIMGRGFLNMIKTAFQEMPEKLKDHVERNFERVVHTSTYV